MTLAEIAVELGISESQVRRDESSVLAKLRAVLDPNVFSMAEIASVLRAILDSNFLSTENPPFSRVPRRFSDNRVENVIDASRAATLVGTSPPPLSPGGARRAGLPSRFPRKP